jgi:uncharacterized protein YaaN involved in tellurite resistance
MNKEERSSLEGFEASLVDDSKEIAPTAEEPSRPEEMGDEEAQALHTRARDIIRQLENASGSRELAIVDTVTSVGVQSQRQAASELELLRANVGDMLTKEGPSGQVTKDLADLRLTLKQINPNELRKTGLVQQMFNALPGNRRFLRVVEKIAMRYEPISQQVVVIESRLREGQGMLTRDNVELRKLYEEVEAQQLAVQKNAYLGELLMQQLQGLVKRTQDPQNKNKAQNVLYDVSMRVQDLRTMDEVHRQFFVSIEMTRENNIRLAQAVERTLSLAANVVTVGLAIQMALSRQRRVLEATRRTREFLGQVVVANAEAIKRHTQEIGDVYNEPVIALEKIAQAHDALIEAAETVERLKLDGIESARENIAKLTELAAGIQRKAIAPPKGLPWKSMEA